MSPQFEVRNSKSEIRDPRFRIAFVSIGGTAWPAGPHYLKNLFHAIKAADATVEIALLVPEVSVSPPPCQGTVDFLAGSPSRRRQERAAPQGERQSACDSESNDSQTVRAEALEARSSHLSTVPQGGGKGEVDAADTTSPRPSLAGRGNGVAAGSGGYGDFDELVDHHVAVPTASGWRELVLQMQRQLRLAWGPEPAITAELRRQRIDVVFAPRDLGPRFPLPLLCWVPDFQPLRMPEMYAPGEAWRLGRGLATIAAHASRVIVSSGDALSHFQRFAPGAAGKARVLSFVAQVPAGIYDTDPTWVCERYGLPAAFVYLPNQLWRHKNHGVVIDAVQQLRDRPEITVVCTGQPRDARHLGYYEELQRRVAAAGLQRQFVMLGLIPHGDVYALMRQSVAVLQPSLFEGWSTSVEEAKSLGKRVILSDIAVHREQDPPGGLFFDPRDPAALAQALAQTFSKHPAGPDPEMEATARRLLPARTRAFGAAFLDIVGEVVGQSARRMPTC